MIGEHVESAIWLSGNETKEMLNGYKNLVIDSIHDYCRSKGFVCGDVKFTELHPYDKRVPKVPGHVEKQANSPTTIRLLVAEAVVTQPLQINSFVANLEKKDLERLRKITRKKRPWLSDFECDEIIEEIGPDAAVETMRMH